MDNNSLDGAMGSEVENKFEELNFDEVGDKLEQNFDETVLKPVLNKNTNAVIQSVEFLKNPDFKVDSKNKKFNDVILRVTCFIDEEADEYGGCETVDNYGGLREYSNHFWNGNKSAFGKLRQLAEDEFGINNYKELIRVLVGAKVKLRTVTTSFQGQEYSKNIIQMFK